MNIKELEKLAKNGFPRRRGRDGWDLSKFVQVFKEQIIRLNDSEHRLEKAGLVRLVRVCTRQLRQAHRWEQPAATARARVEAGLQAHTAP